MKNTIFIAMFAFFQCFTGITYAADAEDAFWKSVTKGNVVEEYEIYLQQYPKGRYTVEARKRIDQFQTPALATPQATDEYRRTEANTSLNLAKAAYARKDERETLLHIQKAADLGHPDAQNYLGSMYQLGRGGLTKDEPEAVRWYRKSADQGNADGQNNIGSMYQYGQGGVTKDEAEAVKWYRKSADQGNAQGQANLGFMYANGRGGLTKDEAEAVRWYRKSADQGNAQGQNMLGVMYQYGQGGVTKDEAEAVKWYRKSADQGNAQAQENLRKLGL